MAKFKFDYELLVSKTSLIDINEANMNPSNPRFIRDENFKKLVNSIRDFPLMLKYRPLVLNDNWEVLGGNMRLKACQELGFVKVPVLFAKDLTEEEKKEFIIKDNLGFGEWDWDVLANEWELPQLEGWGLPLPFDTKLEEGQEDDYSIPTEVATDIQVGDLFQIGEHKLLCASSTEKDNWQKLMGDEQCDLVVTDPPYNVDYTGRTKDALKIENDKKTDEDFFNFLYDFFTSLSDFTKSGGSWYVWCADIQIDKFVQSFKQAGFHLAQCLIWIKNNSTFGRSDYHYKHEPCLYGWKKGASHNWYSDRKQTTCLNFDKPLKNRQHPTMKPIQLLAYQISNSSKSGDLVTDGFLGSGSTMVTCHQLKRKCYGMELDPKYCQVILERMILQDESLEVKRNGEPYIVVTNSDE